MAQTKSASRTKKKTTSTAPSRSAPKKAAPAKKPIRRELGAALCLALGIISFLGYFIKDAWLVNGLCMYVFKGLFGWGFYVVPMCFFWMAWILAFHRGRPVTARVVSVALIPLLFGAVVHLFGCEEEYVIDWIGIKYMYSQGIEMNSGGVLAGALAAALKSALSLYGALPLLLVAMVACVCIGSTFSVRKAVDDFKNRERPEYEPEPEDSETVSMFDNAPSPSRQPRALPRSEIFDIDIPVEEKEKPRKKIPAVLRPKKDSWIDIPIEEQNQPGEPEPPAPEKIPDMPQGIIYHGRPARSEVNGRKRTGRGETETSAETVEIPTVGDTFPFLGQPQSAEIKLDNGEGEIAAEAEVLVPAAEKKKKDDGSVAAAAEEITQAIADAGELPEYRYPSVDLLRAGVSLTSDGREEVALNKERLETTLRSFGIGASICDITRGPTVTRYDLELEAGVKLNKLTNLAGDLALSLGVVNVRIAPIPDKISTVGVEVPNKIVSTVYLRDIIDSPAFRNASSKLSFAVGKDIGGNCIVGNISKMPHMLIAGTTGSGKSVCMNSLIISLLYKATPEEVRLIMIDPKMVELGIYNGIPHLFIPVVTDPKKAAGSLQWAVVEMMKRYRLFSEIGVRDLNGYNNYMSKNSQPTLPNVVIVIDELADLMMTAAKEVEESICRVAQMGRAAGMHLVIATQRPSADVITGLMKANIPSRIAFAVSSALESRIILDNQGAEKLIGMGDMLYAPLGCGKPLRVQGAFVTDEEREDVINFIKEGSTPDYNDEIMRTIEKAAAEKDKNDSDEDAFSDDHSGGEGNPFSDYDELLPQAVDVILDTKQASVSMLQRRLKLGYSRAARLVDQMEELGIVGPFEGSKPRQLLITREQWQEMSMTGNTAVEKLINEQKDDFSEGYDQ